MIRDGKRALLRRAAREVEAAYRRGLIMGVALGAVGGGIVAAAAVLAVVGP